MMAKATTIKEAIKKWEEKSGQQAATATDVSLVFQWPPIEKMDSSLASLTNCEKLSLSTNTIEKVSGLNTMKKLRVLSLGRNYIKSFAGMECLGETLEELWISYNLVEKLKGIHVLRNLRVLYMSNNLVKEWSEFNKLQELPLLEDLLFVGNPLYDACELETWRSEAARRLPNLKKLDGETVLREDDPPLTVADMQPDGGDAVETLELPLLEDLLLVGNPLYDACVLETWRSEAARRLPNLKKLDGETVLREDDPPLTVADMQPDGGDAVETLVSAETND